MNQVARITGKKKERERWSTVKDSRKQTEKQKRRKRKEKKIVILNKESLLLNLF